MRALSMRKVLVLAAVFLVLALTPVVFVKSASSQAPLSTVFIRADGTVSPATAPIVQSGNTYTFTDNVYATIKIQRSNVVLDGAGYTLSGSYNGTAMDVWIIGEGSAQLPNGTLAQYTIGIDLANKK